MNAAAMKKYQPTAELGKGGYGTVFKARNINTDQIVAVKKIVLSEAEEGIKNSTLREVAISKSLNHPNCIKLIETISDPKENAVYCVYECMPMDVRAFIRQNPISPELIVKQVAKQTLMGLAYLHSQNIIHRDMKPHNVLIDPKTMQIKLIDFGLARPFETQPTPMSCSCGTKFFLPPEMMLGLSQYNLKSDVWAIGLIMSQMFSNKYIFPCRENEEGLMKIFQIMGSPTGQLLKKYRETPKWNTQYEGHKGTGIDEYMGSASENAKDVFKKLCDIDWETRYSCEEALQHPWFEE